MWNWHFMWSFAKSAVRIIGCLIALIAGNWETMAIALVAAEIIGVVEEL